ncbi:MAG TPA: hypothetical protein VFZ97_03070 [Acidimicrobiales bacterium]
MALRKCLAFVCGGATLAMLSSLVYQYEASPASAEPTNITVDYTNQTPLNPYAMAMDETGYPSSNVLATDPLEQQRFKALGLRYVRIALTYSTPGNPTSKIICGGSGCDTGPTGDQWIGSIKGIGAQPVVQVPTSISSSDAANLVRHFNVNPSTGVADTTLPNYVKYWIIGNEPDLNNYTVSTYSGYFNSDNDAMKAVDAGIKVGGGTTAWYDSSFLQTFLQLSGSRVDFVDFHGYPQQGCSTCSSSTPSSLFQWAHGTGADVANLRAMIQQMVPSRASQISVEVGEWALDWGGSLQANTNLNAVWSADVLGNIIANGGSSMFYGTKGNALEWASGYQTDQDTGQQVFENLDDPHAPYHGYGMFTGEGLFPGFGTRLATATTSLPNVDVFASDNPKNIVVVNKDPSVTQTGVFSLGNVSSGTVDVWQKNPTVPFQNPPVHLGSFTFSGDAFSYSLPALSVTTFVVYPGATSVPPGPPSSPSLSCPSGVNHLAAGEPWAVAAMTARINGQTCPGYWVVTRSGGVTSIGAAQWLGDMSAHALNAPMIGIAATVSRSGYYLLGADGGIFTFGDAHFYGSTGAMRLNAPVVGMAVTPIGGGYWLTAADGGIFTFGNAPFYGSMGGTRLNKPVVGMSADNGTGGYWLVASDGGIFTFNAPYYGSTGSQHLNQPVVGVTPQPDGQGYRLVASDGGVFDFGDAAYYGSLPGQGVRNPQVTTMAGSLDGNGYYLINAAGTVWAFGDAPYLGNA